jgi:hypothetical protein
MVATTFSSAGWAADNGKAKGNAFGQAGDGNPQYPWRAAEESVKKTQIKSFSLIPIRCVRTRSLWLRGEILTVQTLS